MNNGFIKLYRCIEDSFLWNDSQAVHLWLQLLLSANHKPKDMIISGKKKTIESGQFICSRLTLSNKTGISESKVQRLLKLYENEQMIEQQMNSKFRVISILNWEKYQSSEQQVNSTRTASEQQVNSTRTAGEQQVNTNKNDKNDKNKEKENKKKKKFNVDDLKPSDVSDQVWNDFKQHRKEKRASITKSAINKIESEAKKAGYTLENALIELMSRGWQGFKSEWVNKGKQVGNNYENCKGAMEEALERRLKGVKNV